MDADARRELSEIVEAARELLAWEREIGQQAIPRVELPDAAPAARPPESPSSRAPATAPPAAPASPRAVAAPSQRLTVLAGEAASCTRCVLHRGRTKSVFSRGNPAAELMFIGEGPGYHEDQQGAPFVGKAGQLLDKMIGAMGYAESEVYICNVVKCRPPDNRTPKPDEAAACEPYLIGQIEEVAPKVIVALGKCAAQNLGCVDETTKRWRGTWKAYRGIPVMPTYHPAFLLRTPNMKRPVWEDLQKVMGKLGKPVPPGKTRR